ncbi:hypothetical protein LguiA_013297 [Lonicera macranthoides]
MNRHAQLIKLGLETSPIFTAQLMPTNRLTKSPPKTSSYGPLSSQLTLSPTSSSKPSNSSLSCFPNPTPINSPTTLSSPLSPSPSLPSRITYLWEDGLIIGNALIDMYRK